MASYSLISISVLPQSSNVLKMDPVKIPSWDVTKYIAHNPSKQQVQPHINQEKTKKKRRTILEKLYRRSSNQRIKPSKDTQKGRKKKSVLGFHTYIIQGITSIIDTSVSQVTVSSLSHDL